MPTGAGGPPGSFRAFGAASGLMDHHVDQARAQGLLSGDRGRGPAGESMAETVTDPREHILDAAEELAGADHEFFRSVENVSRSEEHTSELQSRGHLVCRLLP